MRYFASAFLLLTLPISGWAQNGAKPTSGSLSIEEVVRMVQNNVSDEVIIASVKRNAKAFDLNADEIVALKKIGVSDMLLKYLVDPSQAYAGPAAAPAAGVPAAPAVIGARRPADPLVLKLPPEAGIYYLKPPDQFTALDPKAVVPYKQPGKAAKFSGGIVKGHIIGSVVGAAAQLRIAKGPSVFYIRLGEKMAIEDIALLVTDREKDRRNIDFGTKPGKPNFPVTIVRQVEPKEVSPGIFRVTTTLDQPGEFFFFVRGSGDEKKGTLGKGYDLGVN
jgi:hypothetical protein